MYGKKSRSHFGLSLASLKDINGDGFEDLAVGAPRDGPEGRGGVYIFLGNSSGIIQEPMQVRFRYDVIVLACFDATSLTDVKTIVGLIRRLFNL